MRVCHLYYGIPAIPPRPIFLPVNVIEGKQSRLPNATNSR